MTGRGRAGFWEAGTEAGTGLGGQRGEIPAASAGMTVFSRAGMTEEGAGVAGMGRAGVAGLTRAGVAELARAGMAEMGRGGRRWFCVGVAGCGSMPGQAAERYLLSGQRAAMRGAATRQARARPAMMKNQGQ